MFYQKLFFFPLETNTTTSAVVATATTQQNSESFIGVVIPCCIYLHSRVALSMKIEDTPTVPCDAICQSIINCEELGLNKQLASQAFCLWMRSPLLGNL